VVWRQGLISARYFLLGWLVILLNTVLLKLTNFSVIKDYPLFDVGQYVGTFGWVPISSYELL